MIPKLTFVYDRKGQGTKNKAASVEMRINYQGKRKYISTGIMLFPKEWNNGMVVGRTDWREINEQLQTLMKKCTDIITQMMDDGSLDINAIPSILRNNMVQTQTFIEYSKSVAETRYKSISKGTKEHYLQFFRFMEEWKGIVYFSDVTEKNILKLDEELTKRGIKEASRWNYHRKMKTFILQAVDDNLIKKNPYTRLDIRKGNEDGLKRYLTPEEFERVEKAIMPNKSLERVRDLFVFQTYTMLSYSDLADFRWKKCTNMKGQIVYKATRQKTKQEFVVVLLDQAINILEKYRHELPIISNVKYNLYLKVVMQYAGVSKPVTTHWARHTGATLLLNKGVSIHIIQHILGHSSIRETEKTYAKLLDETIVDQMALVNRA